MSRLTEALRSALGDAKNVHAEAASVRSLLVDVLERYLTANQAEMQRVAAELIQRQDELLKRLDVGVDSAAQNAQLHLETQILRGDPLRAIEQGVAAQSIRLQQPVMQAREHLNEVHEAMNGLGVAAKREATGGLQYNSSRNVKLKSVEAGLATFVVKERTSGQLRISLPDGAAVKLTFGSVGNEIAWTATVSGNVELSHPQVAQRGRVFAVEVVRDYGSTKDATADSSEKEKSLGGGAQAEIKVFTINTKGEVRWANSSGATHEHTQKDAFKTDIAVRLLFDPPMVQILRGNSRKQ